MSQVDRRPFLEVGVMIAAGIVANIGAAIGSEVLLIGGGIVAIAMGVYLRFGQGIKDEIDDWK